MNQLSNLDPTESWQAYQPTAQRPWNRRMAAHLFRRAAFGGTVEEIVNSESLGPEKTIDQIFDQSDDQSIEADMVTAGRLVTGGTDANQLAAWWLLRMVKTPCPFLEKMTLFWHGHFATGADKVMDARAMFRQNQLLRQHALGKFEPLVKDISSDVAMLIYLDSEENRKTRPNENYARELMELFCLGPGNYSENDIKEVARCFTGWEVRRSKFDFNEHQHDDRPKSFLGTTGNLDGNQAIEVVLQQPAAPLFIAKKLIRFFVLEDAPLSDDFVKPIADQLRQTDFDIKDTVRTILSSNVFYSDLAIGHKIKSPVELAVGFLRFFDASTNMELLSQQLATLGQLPMYPPNVKGWAGGRTWINASTILARANLISDVLQSGKTKFQMGSLDNWGSAHREFEATHSLDWADEFLLASSLQTGTRDAFDKWLNESNRGLQDVLIWLAALPEFQLN